MVRKERVVPGWIQDYGDDSTALDNFKSYLEWNSYVDPGNIICVLWIVPPRDSTAEPEAI